MGAAPCLVIGLGNRHAGDDAVGCRVAERLASDPRLPDGVEVLCDGADLLRLAPRLGGRRRVLLVDACLGERPGRAWIHEHPAPELDGGRGSAHYLSPVVALELLLATMPALRATRFTWLLVEIAGVRASPGLSKPLCAALPALVEAALAELAPAPRRASGRAAPAAAR